MLNSIHLLPVLILAGFIVCNNNADTQKRPARTGRTYYFNNNGDDANEGSFTSPFKTIAKFNALKLRAGDSIYFQAAQVFRGTLILDSTDGGTPTDPVIIMSNGNGKTTIDAGNSSALLVSKTSNITIKQMAFRGAGRKTGNTKSGVELNRAHHITLDSLDISGFQKAGLQINSSADLEIRKVYAFDNGASGIEVGGVWGTKDSRNIHISYCTAENNPGDPTNLTNHSGNGILVGLCRNVLIEYSVATNNGWDMPRKGNGPVGIWCYEADSVIIQHCLSFKNKTAAGAADGGGFDLDGGTTNSVIQYCLSYDNQGSGFGLFQYDGAGNWHNNTVRYSISENDGAVSAAHAGVFIWNSSRDTNQFRDCYFYNNIIYNTKGAAISYEAMSENAGFRFYNNIFVAKDQLVTGKETNTKYLGNCWYSLFGGFNMRGSKDLAGWANANDKEKLNNVIVGINHDPGFPAPRQTNIISIAQLSTVKGYLLPENSILRTNGLDLKLLFGIDNGGKSFNQTTAPTTGIGASF